MRPYKLAILIFLCSHLFWTGCEKTMVDFDNDALISIKTPSINSNSYTSIIATRKDASVEISLKYFDPGLFYKERNYTVYPDYFEVYLSKDEGASWEMIRTLDSTFINKSFIIPGLLNGNLYYVYLKETFINTKSTKNTNVALFVPSAFKPTYSLILTDYYDNDLYSFDWNSSDNNIVYATTYYEFKPGYAAASVFISRSDNEQQLVDINAWFPHFNEDGTKISFSSDKGEKFDGKLMPEHIAIYDINTKTTNRITSGYSVNRYPVWSPDNSQIAFSYSEKSDESLRIALLNSDTHIQKILQTESVLNQNILSYSQIRPTWSADGKYIYFTLWYSTDSNIYPGLYDIYRISTNGGIPEPVISSPWIECTPVISPDDSKLAFLTDFNGKLQIWVYDYKNNKFHQPFDNDIYSFDEVWSQLKWKDNNTILFANRSGLYSISVE